MYWRFILLFFFSTTTPASDLKPFTSDGCSAFPDGTLFQQSLWSNCCFSHDLAYWKGGSAIQKNDADLRLKQCVESVGEPEIAKIMLAGVRVGGSPFLNTSFRWGYGWPYGRGYKFLSKPDKLQAILKLNAFKQMIDKEIKLLSINESGVE